MPPHDHTTKASPKKPHFSAALTFENTTPPIYHFLLEVAKGDTIQVAVRKTLNIPASTASKFSQRLAHHKLILRSRRVSPADTRIIDLIITEKGREFIRDFQARIHPPSATA